MDHYQYMPVDLPPGPGRDLVDILRRLRYESPLTNGALARRIPVSPNYLSEVLNGRKTPRPLMVERIARHLGADAELIVVLRDLAQLVAEQQLYNRRRHRETTVSQRLEGNRGRHAPIRTDTTPCPSKDGGTRCDLCGRTLNPGADDDGAAG